MPLRTYQCEECKGTFMTDKEPYDIFNTEETKEERVELCDDCFNRLMKLDFPE